MSETEEVKWPPNHLHLNGNVIAIKLNKILLLTGHVHDKNQYIKERKAQHL